jgi:hypothetical protein
MTDRRDGREWRRQLLPLGVLLGAFVLVSSGVRNLGAEVDGALQAAGFLTGPGPDGLFEVAALPLLVVLVILFFRRDLMDGHGLRLAAMGLGAGAGILLADPLARVALHLGLPGLAPTGEGGVLRITVNLLVLAVVAVLFARAVLRELRRAGPKDGGTRDEEGEE